MSSPTHAPPEIPSGSTTLSDAAFVTAIESCLLPATDFRHADHVRLAWIYLGALPLAKATERMVASIRRFAEHHGAGMKYHDTMTRLWMRLVAHARAATGPGRDFIAFAASNPALFDGRCVFEYYSAERLFSSLARAEWVDPDLRPLPTEADRQASVPADR
jgi:hypothetical protein